MQLIASVGFGLVLPVVALVFGGAAIGDLRDDKTLVYLWLRPMDRWPIVVGAALAAATLAAPITLISIVLAAILTGAGNGIVSARCSPPWSASSPTSACSRCSACGSNGSSCGASPTS